MKKEARRVQSEYREGNLKFYEEEVNQITNSLASIIEPILIVGLGGIVGFIVLSVLGPILSIQGTV